MEHTTKLSAKTTKLAEAAQVGVKVIVVDVPRPTPGAITDDIRPGQPIILPPRNGHK